MFSWRNNQENQLGFPGREWNVQSPRMIPFFSEKGLKVEEVVGSYTNSFFLCEGGELFGAGDVEGGRLGNSELKTYPNTPILIDKDVERVFTGSQANYVFFTKLDESVWSFGKNSFNQRGFGDEPNEWGKSHYNQRGFEGNEPKEWGIRLHKDLASNEIIKIACGTYHTLILKKGGKIYGAGAGDFICGLDGESFQPIPGLGEDLVFIDIVMGEGHSLALTEDFQVFVWGENYYYGQLGLGDLKDRMNPEKLELPEGLKSGPISISCGPNNSWILKGDWRTEWYSRLLLIEDLNDFEF